VAVKNAFEYVYKTIEEEGPFDGALGFSQGASCLTSLLLNHEREGRGPQADLFKFVVLFSTSGTPEWDVEDKDGAKVRIPSLHVCSEADAEWFEDSKAVVRRCEEGSAELVTHGGGHAVPKDRPSVNRIIKGIEGVLDRAKLRTS
jgi:predicted esterase